MPNDGIDAHRLYSSSLNYSVKFSYPQVDFGPIIARIS